MDDCADVLAHRLHQRRKLPLRVADQNIIVGVEHEEGDQLLGVEGLTGAGNAQQKGRLIEQVFLVAHDKVVADGVLPEIDTALVHNLLHLKGNEHRKALGGQRPKGVDTPGADGQYRVEAIELLILQHRKLAHMFPGNGQHRLRVGVKLFQCFGGQHHRNNAQHHALVAGSEIVQKLLCLLALQLHIIGDHGREVVVGVLAALPVGDVRFHPQQPVFHLAHSLVRRNRNNVDGEHHIPAHIRQLRHHVVLDIRGVVLEIQHPAEAISQH